jgi:hypothetical protein
MRMRRIGLGAGATAAGVALLATALVGCGPAPWATGGGGSSPTSSSTAVPTPIPNDLSGGSTERDLTAGPVSATVKYWSTLAMSKWTAGALKPLSLSMETTVTPSDGQKVYLQQVTMTVVPATSEKDFTPLAPQSDTAPTSPGYLVLSPYSYSQTFNIGPVPETATFLTIQFAYDLLVQTTPTSTEYAKQTATDTITVAITK